MRVRLIVTVAAAVSMVLLAMLVPMALLLRSLALEDRLARAALEVQATESVVATDDRGDIAVYVANVNEQDPALRTTVLYAGDEPDIGPTPGEDERVQQARLTGIARVDDVDDGAEILVPVSLGPSSGPPAQTPVIRVEVAQPSLGSGIYRIWLILAALGLLLLAGALVLADRLGRGFVGPIERLSAFARHLGQGRTPAPVEVTGPGEVRQLGQSINQLVERVQELLARERASVSDLSTGCAPRSRRCGSGSTPCRRRRTGTGSPPISMSCRRWSTRSCGRPDDPNGRAWSRSPTPPRCSPTELASGSRWPRTRAGRSTCTTGARGRCWSARPRRIWSRCSMC